MTKKKRLGSDLLDPSAQTWIRDTREEAPVKAQEEKRSTQKGLSEGWTRATFIVREELLEKVKDLAYWERLQIKEVIEAALEAHLKGKRIKKRPEGR